MAKRLFLFCFLLVSIQISAQCWQSIAAGSYHTIGIKNDGTLWAWGRTWGGATGLGTLAPDAHAPVQVGTDTNWQSVYAGSQSSYAIKTDGTLWGCGIIDQIDLGSYFDVPYFTQVGTDNNWQFVTQGKGLKTDGTLWTWGPNDYGQLGTGSSVLLINYQNAVQLGTDNNWKSVASGLGSCHAVKTDGTLWAWGKNNYGQLGDGTTTNQSIPVQIGTQNDWLSVSQASESTFAIKTDGTLWGWGANGYGQIGIGNQISYITTPTQVGTGNDWKAIYPSGNYAQAIKNDNSRWAWGHNQFSTLGDGSNTSRLVPTQAGTATDWLTVATGGGHVMALKTDHTLYAWGTNMYGEMGNNTTTTQNPNTPALISNCSSLAVQEYTDSEELVIYPNPVKNALFINGANDSFPAKIIITDFTGREVISSQIETNTLNVQGLTPGVYVLCLIKNGRSYCKKFIRL